jgi:hypothetical protein
MEFFIPGLSIFLLAVVITFVFSPKATPMLAAVLSLLFLSYGVYDHYRMFLPEYRLSTWQQTVKMYSPHIMIGGIIVYVIISMIAFFTGGIVPVPTLPTMEIPEMPAITTNQMTKSLNTAVNAISNTASNLADNTLNRGNSLLNSLNNSLNNSLGLNNSTKNNNMSRSAVEAF